MKATLIRCDGAGASGVPRGDWEVLNVQSVGSQGEVNIRIPSLSAKLGGNMPPVALDLIRIAAFAYWADQMVRRPADTDVFGELWRRHFLLAVPVLEPETWRHPGIRSALADALGYGTDDYWEFYFEKGSSTGQSHLFKVDASTVGEPDSVLLFSGGTDSLCAAVEEATSGRRPLLISHSPSPRDKGRQRTLKDRLAGELGGWHFPQRLVEISKIETAERERTQRTRGFLYSAIGATVARGFGIDDVVVADNGWVSVGLPISGQAIGAKMSRTTHPRFQFLFNRLLDLVLPGIRVRNPLLFRTRGECLQVLRDHELGSFLKDTQSCAAASRLANDASHCGVCSQCIDRRIGVAAAGLQAHDVKYNTDAFLGHLEGDALMLAEAYVRLMRGLLKSTPDELVRNHVEVVDCATFEDTGGPAAMQRICRMLINQAQTISAVLSDAAASVMPEIVSGEFSANSMVRLALAGRPAPKLKRPPAPLAVELSIEELRDCDRYDFRSQVVFVFTGKTKAPSSNVVKVNGLPLVFPDAEFILLLRLVLELYRGGDGYCLKGVGKATKGLVPDGYSPPDVDNAIYRLRRRLESVTADLDPKDLLEGRKRGWIRLSTHRRFIQLNLSALQAHENDKVKMLAKQLQLLGAEPPE